MRGRRQKLTQNHGNKARMFMKTKDRGLAQTLLLNVCDAPKAQFRQIVPLALTCPFGTSQTPQDGACANRNWRAKYRISTEQSQNVYENKGSRLSADIAFECLRCAEGAFRQIVPLALACPFGTSQTPQGRGLRQPELAREVQDFDGTKPECL